MKVRSRIIALIIILVVIIALVIGVKFFTDPATSDSSQTTTSEQAVDEPVYSNTVETVVEPADDADTATGAAVQ